LQVSLERGWGQGNFKVRVGGKVKMKLGSFLKDPCYDGVKFNKSQVMEVEKAIKVATNGFKIGLEKSLEKMLIRGVEEA
jgi:hypothetical protein